MSVSHHSAQVIAIGATGILPILPSDASWFRL